jgi:hypothetical protein
VVRSGCVSMYQMTCPTRRYISHLSIECSSGTDQKGCRSVTLRAVGLSDGALGHRGAFYQYEVTAFRPDRRCRPDGTSASYSGGPEFIYESEDQLF